MNHALWAAQVLLAVVFIGSGWTKLFAYDKYKAVSEKRGPSGIRRGLAQLIGMAEIAGALGLILPMTTNVAPWLTAWAGLGLALVMFLAIGYHLRRHERPILPAVLLVLAALVALGHFSHKGITNLQDRSRKSDTRQLRLRIPLEK